MGLEEILAAIPVTTKEDLVHFGNMHEELYQQKAILFSETSGTTGAPLLTPRGDEDLKWNTNNQMLSYKRHLQPSIDRVAIIHPGILSPFVEASVMALNNLGIGLVRLYPVPKVCDYRRMLTVLQRNNITTIMTTPTLAYKLLYEVSVLEPTFRNFPVSKFLLTGEYISEANAANIKKIVGPNAYTIPFVYGSSEAATLMYGVEDCSYRAITEDFVFELVDPESNEWIRDGQTDGTYTGKLVVSWLRDGLLPILRYDTNDIFCVTKVDDDHRWEMVGRSDGTKTVSVDERAIDKLIYESAIPVYHYGCQVRSQTMDIDIVTTQDYVDEKIISRLTDNLYELLNKKFELSMTINPKNHPFYDFSLSPKMKRFSYV